MRDQLYSHDEIIDWLESPRGYLWREDNMQKIRYWQTWAWLKPCPGGDSGEDYTHPSMNWMPAEDFIDLYAGYDLDDPDMKDLRDTLAMLPEMDGRSCP